MGRELKVKMDIPVPSVCIFSGFTTHFANLLQIFMLFRKNVPNPLHLDGMDELNF